MSDSRLQMLLENEILPAVFNTESSRFVASKVDVESSRDQIQSDIFFVTAVVENDGVKTGIPLVVKVEPSNLELRVSLKTGVQFHNEVLMYNEVLPFLDQNDIVKDTYAKFYHGVGTVGADDNILILEDLRMSGYKLTTEKTFIDSEHLCLALSKLGKFHALSYAAKKRSSERFFELVEKLKETAWDDEHYHPLISGGFHRAIDPLIKQGKHVEVLQKLLNVIDASVAKFMKRLLTPDEPMAIICHGDFCRNNIVFKYDQGKPVDVKFFDIAATRYSSPVVDIAFFVLLNSSKQVRQAHWDDLLAAYHHGLSTAIPGTDVPTLEDIQAGMKKMAIYGFAHCSFFLPTMLYRSFVQVLGSKVGTPEEELALKNRFKEKGAVLLSDMVEELIERGCLSINHQFLQEE